MFTRPVLPCWPPSNSAGPKTTLQAKQQCDDLHGRLLAAQEEATKAQDTAEETRKALAKCQASLNQAVSDKVSGDRSAQGLA